MHPCLFTLDDDEAEEQLKFEGKKARDVLWALSENHKKKEVCKVFILSLMMQFCGVFLICVIPIKI